METIIFLIIGMKIAVFWMALIFCVLLAYLQRIKEFYFITLAALCFMVSAVISELWVTGAIDGKTMILYEMIFYLIAGLLWIPVGMLMFKRFK